MNALLLALLLVQTGPQNMGVVTGMVRAANGAPSAGVRVYAVAVRDAVEAATAGTTLESIAQTDAAGRYRLEVAAGRYYIASGSVGSPTYYPGTTNVSTARVISIAAGGVVENIDFSSFVPAARTPTGLVLTNPMPPLPPGSTGVLQGTVRFQNGQPAAQMPIVAIPTAAIIGPGTVRVNTVSTAVSITIGAAVQNSVTRRLVNGYDVVQAFTDSNGRYRLENLPPQTYYIATGTADAPQYFPGTPDLLAARTIVTTPTTSLDSLDFTVAAQPAGVAVRGRVSALGGGAAAGATVQLTVRRSNPGPSNLSAFGLPTRSPIFSTTVKTDGTFELSGALPGIYDVVAHGLGVRAETRTLTITDQPVTGLDFALPVASLSGRILLEDGSALPDPQLFAEAIVTTVDNPNIITSTIMAIAGNGTFGRLLEANQYRFYLRNLPEGYAITSITSGSQDLLKETLKVSVTEPANIEVRVARSTRPAGAGYVKVSGRVLESFTGAPSPAAQVRLCCLDRGPFERFSTSLSPDGSFEFGGVSAGRYELDVLVGAGQPRLYTVDGRVEVGDQALSGLTVLTTPQLGELTARIVFESGSMLPASSGAIVTFSAASGRVKVVGQRSGDRGYAASVPTGDFYSVSVTNLPEAYAVKSISGPIDFPRTTQANTFSPIPAPPVLAPFLITIVPAPVRR